MPSVTDYLQKVYELTDRPDRVAETTSALRRALRQVHLASDFYPDLQLQQIANPGTQVFSSPLPTRFRRTYSIVNESANSDEFVVREMSPIAKADEYVQMDKRNTYFLAGTQINFNIVSPFSSLQHRYLWMPDFSDSFVMQNGFEDGVFSLAASYVFMALRDTAQADRFRGLGVEVMRELVTSNFVLQQS